MSLVMPTNPVTRLQRLEKCSSCKFHAPQAMGPGLECHRNPPQGALVPGPNGQPTAVSFWPPVPPDAHCWEWKPRIETGKPS